MKTSLALKAIEKAPIPADLPSACRKAAHTLSAFFRPTGGKRVALPTDHIIPPDVFARARGLAILHVVKVGFVWSGRVGSGLVLAKLDDGTWSAPSAVATAGVGVGGQVGAEVTDFVILLMTPSAVRAFTHGGNFTLGGNLSIAAGPVGRSAEASGTAANLSAIYSYSRSKGLFIGVSLEGSLVVEMKRINRKFYHRDVSAKEILTGAVNCPAEARELLRILAGREREAIEGPEAPQATLPAMVAGGLSNIQERLAKVGLGTSASTGGQGHSTSAAFPPGTRPGDQLLTASSSEATLNPTFTQPAHTEVAPQPHSAPTVATTDAVHGHEMQGNRPISASPYIHKSPNQLPPPVPRRPSLQRPISLPTAVAQYNFEGVQEGDLRFRKGDRIEVVKQGKSQQAWWLGRLNGQEGLFPANYVSLE